MDKKQITILAISALTDFIITFGTALGTAMVQGGTTQLPTPAVVMFAAIGALVSGARTVQQYLKGLQEKEQAVEQTKVEEQAKN